MRASKEHFWLLLIAFVPAPAAAARTTPTHAIAGQTISAAAIRIVEPFGLITSTFRSVEHNRAVGGVPDSYHLLGRAIDIVRKPGVSHAQIAAALARAGFHLIESLDEGDHSHFAFGPIARKVLPVVRPVTTAPPKSLLAADQHGTLRLDLAAPIGMERTKIKSGSNHWRTVH